jgi:glutaredoxin
MKKYLIILVIATIFIYQKREDIKGLFVPPPDYTAAHDVKVVMYATAWCPYCAKARTLLKENNIPYFEYDNDESQEGREQYMALGGNGVPLLQIGDSVVKGYDPSEILRLAKGD